MSASSAYLIYEFEENWQAAAIAHLRTLLVPSLIATNGHILGVRDNTEVTAPWVTVKYSHAGNSSQVEFNALNVGLLAAPCAFQGSLSVMIQTHRTSTEVKHKELVGRIRWAITDWSRTLESSLTYYQMTGPAIEQPTQISIDVERNLDVTALNYNFTWIIMPDAYPGTV